MTKQVGEDKKFFPSQKQPNFLFLHSFIEGVAQILFPCTRVFPQDRARLPTTSPSPPETDIHDLIINQFGVSKFQKIVLVQLRVIKPETDSLCGNELLLPEQKCYTGACFPLRKQCPGLLFPNKKILYDKKSNHRAFF